jgi:hypothetical protein
LPAANTANLQQKLAFELKKPKSPGTGRLLKRFPIELPEPPKILGQRRLAGPVEQGAQMHVATVPLAEVVAVGVPQRVEPGVAIL